jgi:hypothetical protein
MRQREQRWPFGRTVRNDRERSEHTAPQQAVIMGSFTDVGRSSEALEHLRALGIRDEDITVMSSVPYGAAILGRPPAKTRLPQVALASAALGLAIGVFFAIITPYLYVIRVGGQAISPVPPTLLLLYEFTMLFLVIGTFGGLLVLGHLAPSEPQYADPLLSADRIVLVVQCPPDRQEVATRVLRDQGAVEVQTPERRKL